MNKKIYKFINWNRGSTYEDIEEELDEIYKKGWKVVSFQKDVDGTIIVLLKKKGK